MQGSLEALAYISFGVKNTQGGSSIAFSHKNQLKSGALISSTAAADDLQVELPAWPPFLQGLSQPAPLLLLKGNPSGLSAHSADYALLMGLLRSSWWLILGLFLHFTHLLTSVLPPVAAVTLVVQSQAGCWLSFSAICTNASLLLPPRTPSLSVLFPMIP